MAASNVHDLRTAAIIVHYGDPELTGRAVRSLSAGTATPAEILVVDNGPDPLPNGWLGDVRGLRVVGDARNVGFSRAVAAAVNELDDADFVWLFNNDATASRRALAELLLASVESGPRSLVSSEVVDEASGEIWFQQARFIPWRLEAQHEPAMARFRQNTLLVFDERPTWRQAFYLSGCSLLVPMTALRELGGLDTTMFMYGEDVDFSIRASRAGWKLVVARRSIVTHRSSSGSTSDLQERRKAEAGLRLTWRYHPWLVPAALQGAMLTGVKRAVWRRQSWWVGARLRGYIDGVRSIARRAPTGERLPGR